MAEDIRLRRLDDIPIPNPALADWMVSARAKAEVEAVAGKVLAAYVSALPMSRPEKRHPRAGQGNLRAGADVVTELMQTKNGPRWSAWVINRAESYRDNKGTRYARFIEYGRPKAGIRGGGQLRRAAAMVAADARASLAAFESAAGAAGDDYTPSTFYSRPERSSRPEPRYQTPARRPRANPYGFGRVVPDQPRPRSNYGFGRVQPKPKSE